MEQIRFDGLPERRGQEVKILEGEDAIQYRADGSVAAVKFGWHGGDDFVVMQILLDQDGNFAGSHSWVERQGREASERPELPEYIMGKAISMAREIYRSRKERPKKRAEKEAKKTEQAERQRDLDFGE